MTYARKPPSWPVYSAQAEQCIVEAIRNGAVYDYAGEGPVVELEGAFSEMREGRYALSVNSGISALFALYAALGIGSGDEVIVPNLTFLSTVSPLIWLGAAPIVCDSAKERPGVDAATIGQLLTPRTRAIADTHIFGHPVDMHSIGDLARREGILLIEDCSHAHASTFSGRHVRVFGDGAAYSLGASRMVSGGHGGMLTTPHSDVRDAAMLIAHFKPRTRTGLLDASLASHAEFALGGNSRLSPLAAILALDHLSRLRELSDAKLANIEVLDMHVKVY